MKDDGQTAGETPDIPSEDSDAEPHDDDAPGTDTKSSEHSPVENEVVNGTADSTADKDPTTRFDELVKERDALRLEVTQVRQSLEQLQVDHDNELENLKTQLEESQGEKDYAEEQYQNLLGKVNTIRSQLAERMKNDAEDLAQARVQIDELEEQKNGLQEQCTARSAEVDDLRTQIQEQSKDLSSLRNRSTLSQQNWIKEKEELLESEAYMREEYDNAKQAMHDWEVLAMEERTIRKDLSERVKDLEESLENIRDGYQKATEERNTQSSTVDGLQKALQELQNVRKSELKEIVESSQAEITGLRENIQELEKALEVSRSDAEATKTELERTLPFEKEVKEKNLLIGKLRHETVILSDHLTKALRFLRKGKPEDNVDRYVSFPQLPSPRLTQQILDRLLRRISCSFSPSTDPTPRSSKYCSSLPPCWAGQTSRRNKQDSRDLGVILDPLEVVEASQYTARFIGRRARRHCPTSTSRIPAAPSALEVKRRSASFGRISWSRKRPVRTLSLEQQVQPRRSRKASRDITSTTYALVYIPARVTRASQTKN